MTRSHQVDVDAVDLALDAVDLALDAAGTA